MNIQALRPDEHKGAARLAITWLEERHRKGWRNAFKELLDDWLPEGTEAGEQLDEDGLSMVSTNVNEWLIARGEIQARGGQRDINAYLLSSDGPFLTPGQRDWIAQLGARPLRLYRVTDVRQGEGLTLIDELDAQAEPQQVREVTGSRTAKPGMLLGARLMQIVGIGGEVHQELSGATYPFAKLREAAVLEQVKQVLAGATKLKLHKQNQRDLFEAEIARAWIRQWFEPAPLPQIRDASTGEPFLLVTDHYQVLDAAALAAALDTQADVSGDAQQGWDRMSVGADGLQRSLSAINPGRTAKRIELFHRTQRLADDGRLWFEALAGAAVKHLTREIADPVGSLSKVDAKKPAPAPRGNKSRAPGLAPEEMTQAFGDYIHRHYANWADEVIPALGGLTPRQAIPTPRGLERVKGLLREYEEGERQQSSAQGRPAVSYQFLWDALGISK